jgi:HK97 family phage prohead protease
MKEIRLCEIRTDNPVGTNGLFIIGTPIVYDVPTVIADPAGGFTEIIRGGALSSADISDARLMYNHDLNRLPLARTPKTMQLNRSAAGLEMIAELPDTEEAKAVHTAVKRGDLSGMSFAFKVSDGGDLWNKETRTREILKIEKIYEISIVPFPAYPQTSVEARSRINQSLKNEALIKCNQIVFKGV